MKKAISQGRALSGWSEAREKLWSVIDRDTILVGHALQHDLDVLRMVHTRVVDSAILTRNAVGMNSGQWGLQRLCKELLSLQIRQNEGGVHDCLEDVLATRELVLWCTQNKAELDVWAEAKRAELVREEEKRAALRLAKEKAKSEELKDGLYSDLESDLEEDELYWSDIAKDYNPWCWLD